MTKTPRHTRRLTHVSYSHNQKHYGTCICYQTELLPTNSCQCSYYLRHHPTNIFQGHQGQLTQQGSVHSHLVKLHEPLSYTPLNIPLAFALRRRPRLRRHDLRRQSRSYRRASGSRGRLHCGRNSRAVRSYRRRSRGRITDFCIRAYYRLSCRARRVRSPGIVFRCQTVVRLYYVNCNRQGRKGRRIGKGKPKEKKRGKEGAGSRRVPHSTQPAHAQAPRSAQHVGQKRKGKKTEQKREGREKVSMHS